MKFIEFDMHDSAAEKANAILQSGGQVLMYFPEGLVARRLVIVTAYQFTKHRYINQEPDWNSKSVLRVEGYDLGPVPDIREQSLLLYSEERDRLLSIMSSFESSAIDSTVDNDLRHRLLGLKNES